MILRLSVLLFSLVLTGCSAMTTAIQRACGTGTQPIEKTLDACAGSRAMSPESPSRPIIVTLIKVPF